MENQSPSLLQNHGNVNNAEIENNDQQQSLSQKNNLNCDYCDRILGSKGGKTTHMKKCQKRISSQKLGNTTTLNETVLSSNVTTNRNKINLLPPAPDPPPPPDPPETAIDFEWGEHNGEKIIRSITLAYEKIVFWRKNLFLLPTSKSGREYIDETSRLLNEWVHDSPVASIAFKAIMIMPSLLLQKPFKSSKTKDHVKVLERRLELWKNGNIEELVIEGKTIQDNLPIFSSPKKIGEISQKFKKCMQKGNINGALKLLTNNMANGILPLNEETLNSLKQKHPKAKIASEEVLLPDEPKYVHPVFFERITTDTITKAALKTKGGSGPSNLDADGWRRILLSNCFGDSSANLCQAIASVSRKLCTQDCKYTEAFLACRLIPLNKNLGLRPIGVGEILRRIIGKAIISVTKDHITKSVTSLQVCAGQEGGCEAAIHAMKDIFSEEDTEAVLLIDASNAFNAVNRKAFLHNVKIICPEIAVFVSNCYSTSSRLFVIGGVELLSQEGTTQGDPVAMAIYAVATIPLLLMILEITNQLPGKNTKAEGYADDVTAAGSIHGIKCWWDHLCRLGPLFGYYPEPKKCWLIVKPRFLEKAKQNFADTKINITTEGKRHLGASIGSESHRNEFVEDKINSLCEELLVLSEIARIEPHAAYTCFVGGFKHKLSFIMRTIPDICHHMTKLDNIVTTKFLPTITGGMLVNENERLLISLPAKDGGLAIPIFRDLCQIEYENSKLITSHLTEKIKIQQYQYTKDPQLSVKKNQIKEKKKDRNQSIMKRLETTLNENQLRLVRLNQEPGASAWLTSLPLQDEDYHLNKQCFIDMLRIRYGWALQRTPSHCECGSPFSLEHALTCKKGGFVSLRHNNIRDFVCRQLKEVCRDVKKEPVLQPLVGIENLPRSSNTSSEARLDISARGFWVAGQKAFFDVRVFNPLAKRYATCDPQKSYELNEREKKREYNERIMQIEHASFTPLVFSATGGAGRECKKFCKRLAELLSEKSQLSYAQNVSWLQRKVNFMLLRSIHTCFRGSRSTEIRPLTNYNVNVSEALTAIRQ